MWTLYGQEVDLEGFAKDHPGGELHLRLGQGIEDCTRLYESYHVQNDKHHAVLKKWGVTAPTEPSAFHADLKKMVQDYESRVGTIKATWTHIAILSAFAVVTLVCAYGWAMGSVPAMICLPFFSWMLFVNSSHDASHSAFSRKPWVNNLVAWTSAPLFYLPTTWYGQHVVSHHMHTNEQEYDLDLHHFHGTKVHPDGFKPFPYGGWWISAKLHWTMATIAMSYLYPLAHLSAGVANLTGAFGRPVDQWMDERYPHFMHMKHWRLIRTFEPLILVGPMMYAYCYLERPILFYTVPYAIASILFMIATQVSHIQEACQTKQVLNEPDWIKRQAMTSLDYAVDSDFWRWVTGGLNTQALHHSLPPVSCCHFTAMYPYFMEVCKKHKVVVPQKTSLKEAVDEHWTYLSKLNSTELLETLQHMHDHHD